MKTFEEMDLAELYTAMVATDELILIQAKFGLDDPALHKKRDDIAAIIGERFPDVPTEAFATL